MTFSPISQNHDPQRERRAALSSVYAFLIEKGRQRKARLAAEQAQREATHPSEQPAAEGPPCPKA